MGIYRSEDNEFDPGIDIPLGQVPITDTSPGTHRTIGPDLLPIDPAHPYVLVVADPSDSVDEDDTDHFNEDNTASFRKWTVAIVTHGFLLGGIFQEDWITPMADSFVQDRL